MRTSELENKNIEEDTGAASVPCRNPVAPGVEPPVLPIVELCTIFLLLDETPL